MDRPNTPFLQFLLEASVHLDGALDADKALRSALRICKEAFGADEACFAVPHFGQAKPTIYASQPTEVCWARESFNEFLAGRRPRLGATRLYALVERRGRTWGVLALRNQERRFSKSDLKDAARVGTSLSRTIERIDRAQIAGVRARIDRKMMEQLRPLDLFYQVLRGLKTLTHYDHSAAVLIQPADGEQLEVVAERIVWRKGPSRRVGERLSVGASALRLLQRGDVIGLDRRRGAWEEWKGRDGALGLAGLCDVQEPDGSGVMSLLIAPFDTRGENLGALVVASCTPRSLSRYEAEQVQRFLPVAAVAIRNLDWATTLQASVLEAESRNALATLARGVSHDVNNALGAILPRVQQMEAELAEGDISREVLREDLGDIRAGLQVCRRIFGGLLAYARNSAVAGSVGNLLNSIEGVRAVLSESLQRRGIELAIDVPGELPVIRCSQNDLDQLVLNLANNAHDAMPKGGRLQLAASLEGELVHFTILDTGVGIPAEDLPRVKEAFFSTKKHGNGLGLSICRAILWRMRAEMKMESEVGRGTRVDLWLPLAAEAQVESAQPVEQRSGE